MHYEAGFSGPFSSLKSERSYYESGSLEEYLDQSVELVAVLYDICSISPFLGGTSFTSSLDL